MHDIRTVLEHATCRLIRDGRGRYAVIEARAGHVYSLDAQHSVEAPDTPDGMVHVVGPRGWKSRDEAARLFRSIVKDGKHLAETIW